MNEPLFTFGGPPPPKCKHCGLEKGKHRAQTFQCPAKWSRGRAVGYTHFTDQRYEPRAARVRPSTPKQGEGE